MVLGTPIYALYGTWYPELRAPNYTARKFKYLVSMILELNLDRSHMYARSTVQSMELEALEREVRVKLIGLVPFALIKITDDEQSD
eukprot:SAG31_NODE_35835_length_319_cov_0.931818_1_plen_85_part_01